MLKLNSKQTVGSAIRLPLHMIYVACLASCAITGVFFLGMAILMIKAWTILNKTEEGEENEFFLMLLTALLFFLELFDGGEADGNA